MTRQLSCILHDDDDGGGRLFVTQNLTTRWKIINAPQLPLRPNSPAVQATYTTLVSAGRNNWFWGLRRSTTACRIGWSICRFAV